MQTRINSSNGSSGDVDSGVSLANYDKEKNKGNKQHHVVLDTTLDVSSSSDDHSNIDGRNNSSRLVVDDMNDNNKPISASSSSEKGNLTTSPSHDSTEANCNNMSSESIAKHNKMIDDQSTTAADDDDKDNANENECELVVISDNTSTNKGAGVHSSATRCKSANNNQPSHNLENDTSTTAANLQNNNSTTTKSCKKETTQRANNNQKGGGPYSSSSSHIYALREIIYSSSSSSNGNNDVSPTTTVSCEEVQDVLGFDNEEEEEEKRECSRPIYNDINITNEQKNNKVEEGEYPRIITSQIVKTNQDVYKLLECNTAGKVLCSCKQQQHNDSSSSSTNDNEGDEVILTDTNGINFTACNASSIIDQMKNIDIDSSSSSECTTLRMMKNCPISFESSAEQCDDNTTTLPTKKKKYLPIKIYKSMKQLCQRSPMKHRRAKEQRKKKPKMVIKNGIIDWSHSENLENCNNIDEHMLTVEYRTGSAHQGEGMGTKQQQKKKKKKGENRKEKRGDRDRGGITLTALAHNRDGTTMPEEMKTLGSTIFSDESVINNTIKPSEYIVVSPDMCVILECFEIY